MAHCEKYTRAVVGHMSAHYDRHGHNIGNENIDPSRTYLNYNLAPEWKISQGDFIRQRCGEVKSLNRKDVNVLCDWVLTVPKDLPAENHRRFFESGYQFMAKRYGAENVVSAYVHMDELTPHMHFAFVPVLRDPKKGIDRLSAKDVVNRRDLQTFHPDLTRHMERIFGRDIGVENGAVAENGGNLSTQQLRAATEKAEAEAARAAELRENNDELAASINKRYEQQKQEFAKADAIKRKEIEDAKQIRADAEAEAAKIIGAAPIERDRAVQERDEATQETARIGAERAKLQIEVESAKKEKNALESEIRGLAAQKAEWHSSLRREDEIVAVGEEVKPLLGEPYIKCKPGEFSELQKAALGSFARQIRAQTVEQKAEKLAKEMEKMISRFAHDREIAELKVQVRERLKASDTEKEKLKTQADRRGSFIQEKGLGDEYRAWVDIQRQRERSQERERDTGMER